MSDPCEIRIHNKLNSFVSFGILFILYYISYSVHVDDLNFFFPVCRFGSVFLWDSGSSVGNIDGHTKSINAVDYKPTRPFRICTASEDLEVGFFEGPPFKLHHFNKVGSNNNITLQ